MQKALKIKKITPISAELEWIPSTTIPVMMNKLLM